LFLIGKPLLKSPIEDTKWENRPLIGPNKTRTKNLTRLPDIDFQDADAKKIVVEGGRYIQF